MEIKQKRYCKICNQKLVKNGKHSNGKQRWFCRFCNSSKVNNNGDYKKKLSELKSFLDWILTKKTIDESTDKTIRTFYNKTSWCWEIDPLQSKPSYSDILFIDGTHIKRRATCHIVIGDTEPKGHLWTRNETKEAYETLLEKIPKPKAIVTDGGCIGAIKSIWGDDVIIQRCLFHIKMFTIKKLSRKPKTDAGVELLHLVYDLFDIQDEKGILDWTSDFNDWCHKYNSFLKEKSYSKGNKKKWWYTHKNLRAVRTHLRKPLAENHLFQFIYHDFIPRTNNKIEGGINARLKELLRCHRGLKLNK
jgi:hypothetical protein